MKKFAILILLLFVLMSISLAQITMTEEIRDSVRIALRLTKHDTSRVKLMVQMSNYYKFNRPDSAIYYANKALILANKINDPPNIVAAIRYHAVAQRMLGNESKALQLCQQGIKLADRYRLTNEKAHLFLQIGAVYRLSEQFEEALKYYMESKILCDSINNHVFSALLLSNIGLVYRKMNQLDSALHYTKISYEKAKVLNVGHLTRTVILNMAKINKELNYTDRALSYFHESLEIEGNTSSAFDAYDQIAEIYRSKNLPDSSKFYALKSLETAHQSGIYSNIINANLLLSSLHENENPPKALEYKTKAFAYKDSLDFLRRRAALEAFIDFDEMEQQYELESAKKDFQYRIRMNAFLGSSFTLLVIAIFLYRNNRLKQRSKRKVEIAYDRLKNTQSQLIQSEKMASLGELTAGIAHEIQNPLNFVNNFSEVNKEMLEEMNEELESGNLEEVKAIAKDIIENEEKIKHHGQRAEGIVKGMLEHSRTSDGKKESTDLNALADEYLRLAYHGLRAKDKNFNADFKTDFDESLPKIIVIPQDIGRVILNLINNAFQAAAEVEKSEVVVSTKKLDSQIEIKVSDNGPGIPEEIKDKIFQPFFTTKPTGSGTGLGLSLSYDIIKAHGGKISVDSKPSIGTTFIITIPVDS